MQTNSKSRKSENPKNVLKDFFLLIFAELCFFEADTISSWEFVLPENHFFTQGGNLTSFSAGKFVATGTKMGKGERSGKGGASGATGDGNVTQCQYCGKVRTVSERH